MAVQVKFNDNSASVMKTVSGNVKAALQAMGTEAVALIMDGMDTLYGRPIWDTGDLHRDVSYEVHTSEQAVNVGNTLEYAPYVHEGTSRMEGRPYIRDSLEGQYAQERLQKVVEENLKRGFD